MSLGSCRSIFVRCPSRNATGSKGAGFSLVDGIKQFSRVVVAIRTSTSHDCELGMFRVLGVHSLSHSTAVLLGMQCYFVVLFFIFSLSIEGKRLFVHLLTIWIYFLVICLFRIFPFSHGFCLFLTDFKTFVYSRYEALS